MAYTEGSAHPVERLRSAVRDTGSTSIFGPGEYFRWLEQDRSNPFLALRYPDSNNDGVTSATARVNVSNNEDLVLELTTNLGTTTITLAVGSEDAGGGPAVRTLGELIDSIRTNAAGWKVGLGYGDRHLVVWVEESLPDWRFATFRPTLRHMIDGASPGDLAYNRSAAVSAFGDEYSGFAVLEFYNYAAALLRALFALRGRLGDGQEFTSLKKGNASWTRGSLAKRIDQVGAQASLGIYGRIVG